MAHKPFIDIPIESVKYATVVNPIVPNMHTI